MEGFQDIKFANSYDNPFRFVCDIAFIFSAKNRVSELLISNFHHGEVLRAPTASAHLWRFTVSSICICGRNFLISIDPRVATSSERLGNADLHELFGKTVWSELRVC